MIHSYILELLVPLIPYNYLVLSQSLSHLPPIGTFLSYNSLTLLETFFLYGSLRPVETFFTYGPLFYDETFYPCGSLHFVETFIIRGSLIERRNFCFVWLTHNH